MDWLQYQNTGATRNQPLSPELIRAMSFLPEMGLRMAVFSGGQPGIGTSNARVGSTRHDHGGAADAFFYRGNERLDWNNPGHIPIFQDIVRRARANGVTGFGAGPGYMQPGSMHIGFGAPAVWGAGGSGANAPGWLREAFGGATGPVGSATPLSFGGPAPTVPPPMFEGLAPMFGTTPPATPFDMARNEREQERRAEDEDFQARRRALLGGIGSMFA